MIQIMFYVTLATLLVVIMIGIGIMCWFLKQEKSCKLVSKEKLRFLTIVVCMLISITTFILMIFAGIIVQTILDMISIDGFVEKLILFITFVFFLLCGYELSNPYFNKSVIEEHISRSVSTIVYGCAISMPTYYIAKKIHAGFSMTFVTILCILIILYAFLKLCVNETNSNAFTNCIKCIVDICMPCVIPCVAEIDSICELIQTIKDQDENYDIYVAKQKRRKYY